MKLDTSRVTALVTDELAAIHAASSADLVASAPPRALVAAQIFSLPYSRGRTMIAVVGLAPGEPGRLPVPTELEYLRYTVAVADDGSLAVTSRPDRADLVVAAARVLAEEGRAIDTAEAALTGAKVVRPSNFRSWRDAVRSATYDSRLPAAQFGVGAPGWSFVFEPWSTDRGFNQVVLTSGLGVQSINGRAP